VGELHDTSEGEALIQAADTNGSPKWSSRYGIKTLSENTKVGFTSALGELIRSEEYENDGFFGESTAAPSACRCSMHQARRDRFEVLRFSCSPLRIVISEWWGFGTELWNGARGDRSLESDLNINRGHWVYYSL
jgi:hypothetical protein